MRVRAGVLMAGRPAGLSLIGLEQPSAYVGETMQLYIGLFLMQEGRATSDERFQGARRMETE